jgi:nucleoside-diphosphate-sugar epimerase
MAVVAGKEERAWGQAWHVPSGEPRTQQQAVDDIARAAGVKAVPVRTAPSAVMYAMGMFSPLMRELRETSYQFSQDFIMDSSAAELAFGLEASPWDSVISEVVSSFRQ